MVHQAFRLAVSITSIIGSNPASSKSTDFNPSALLSARHWPGKKKPSEDGFLD
jgi:hypothetical protein